VYALDAGTGARRWQVRGDVSGLIVVSGGTAVVEPDSSSGTTSTVVAHALDDGREVWRHGLSDISAAYADQGGFALVDYRTDTVTLVQADSGKQLWKAALSKIDNLEQAPVSLAPDGALAVLEQRAVAFVDRDTGTVAQVPVFRGMGRAVGRDNTLFVTSPEQVRRVTADGVSWTARLPHFTQSDPAALDDGGVAVHSEDLECAVAT
jgi:outer membrane protein assembly factor BamB